MGLLSIVATPIGNLGDITFRALWTLKEADVIYAEDTRVTAKLLAHYGLRTPILRLDAATEMKKAGEILKRLEAGEKIALVSDAGTPGISDPGARLVAHVRQELPEAKIETLPGPSAVIAALSIAGLSTDHFLFLGFLPHKKGRQTAIKGIVQSTVPVVLYESPHRIIRLLTELAKVAPKARVIIGRELTKVFEEILDGTPKELVALLEKNKTTRGEFVVIIDSSRSK